MASEQIVYNIIARDQASKKFKDVGDASEKAGKRISGGFSKLGLLAGGAAAAVGGLAAAGAVMGIKTAANLEQAQIGFTTLLGSATKAGTYVKDLQKFAAATPFEFNGLVDSSRLLLGVGVAANDVIPMLTDFGDAAGALGIKQDAFQRIMLATSQAISAGRFQVGDINQLVNNGLPAWSLLSKATGKPVPELRKLASQGKLLAKDVLPVLQKEMHKDYGGAMQKQSQTLSGLWSTFTDTLSQGLASALLPLVPVLKSILPGAMNVMGGALRGLAGFLKFVVEGISGLVHAFKGGGESSNGFVNAIKGIVNWVRGNLIPTIVETAKSVFPALKSAFKSITDTIRSNKGVFEDIGRIFTGVVIPALGLAAKTIIPAVALAFKVFVLNLKTFILPTIKATILSIVTIIGWVLSAATAAFGWIPGVGGKLKAAKKAFDTFAAGVKAALNGIPSHKEINIIAKANLGFTQTGTNNKRAAGRAVGGPVTAGTPYIVGERRAELFVPDSNGRIVPSVPTQTMTGGGGNTVNIYINSTQKAEDIHRELLKRKRQIGAALGLA